MNPIYYLKSGITVSGYIFDQDMKALSGVNIVEVGTTNSTQTNTDGSFSLNVSSNQAQLKITHVGYDYDIISVTEFNKLGYWNLYYSSTELDPVKITGNGIKNTSSLIPVLLLLALIVGISATKSKNQPKKVTP